MNEINKAIIGLGSNIDPDKNIALARRILAERFRVIGESAFIRTKPIGYTEQDDFINGAVYIETPLLSHELKNALKDIENIMGRIKLPNKCGPRSIDLDIITFNDKIINQDFYERDFVRSSVLELIPNLTY